jgi:hypothetical protein
VWPQSVPPIPSRPNTALDTEIKAQQLSNPAPQVPSPAQEQPKTVVDSPLTAVGRWWSQGAADAQATHQRLFPHSQATEKGQPLPAKQQAAPVYKPDDFMDVIVNGSISNVYHRAYLGFRTSFLSLPAFSVFSILENSSR